MGLFGAIVAGIEIWLRSGTTALQVLLVAILAFDLAGGVWANATPAARRWYHRASPFATSSKNRGGLDLLGRPADRGYAILGGTRGLVRRPSYSNFW